MSNEREKLYNDAVDLLSKLIATPSFSREEDKTASLIEIFLQERGIQSNRSGNNVWAVSRHADFSRPTVLLNSHHDTVKPNPGYTRDPFSPSKENGKLFGLGSNDAGGPLVSLLSAFIWLEKQDTIPFNLVMAATAEEEISGTQGIESIWSSLPGIDFAIVGEPTLTELAVAEKGLMVLDCVSRGKAGHAAREEGINAIYKAIDDIKWFREFQFPKVSEALGKIKMSVTIINAGQGHNQVPAECKFTVDVRVTDAYTLEEVLDIVKMHVNCEVAPRSLRLRSSGVATDHPLVKSGQKLGLKMYGSPTTSDQALIPVPSVKIGPGDSGRSHSADEFIYLEEIRKGIDTYIRLIEGLKNS